MRLTVRPLHSDWTRPNTGRRIRSPFFANWSRTVAELEREAKFLRAEAIVVQLDVTERDVRIDGWIRSDARPTSPRVVMTVDSAKGHLRFYCDRFDKWQDNVRAIVLGLEALRKVERYGIASTDEQYRGYVAIEAGGRSPESVLAEASGLDVLDVRMDPTRAFRVASKLHHPDAGGNPDRFREITEARDALEHRRAS